MSQTSDAWVLDNRVWEEITAATNGKAAPCFSCGVCTAVCPWGLVQNEPVNVRRLMRLAQLGVEEWGDAIWRCTTCGLCEQRCPRGVPVSEVILALRGWAWQKGRPPKGLPTLLWSLHWDGNPWGQPPSRRQAWAKGLDLEPFSAQDEILLYTGCTAAYDLRSRKIARSLAELLRCAGVRFGILPDEPCCGESVRTAGQAAYLKELMEANSRRFREAGVRTLVTISPHCLDMFRTYYPHLDNFRPLHYTEYLLELVDNGRLRFSRPVAGNVTYHDPCYLGRRHGIYEAPRRLLGAIPGLSLREMAWSREEAICCGGGGGRMWLETESGQRFADLRVQEALQLEAAWLATSCPFCVLCLEDSAKVLGVRGLEVVDVAELALRAIDPSAPPSPSSPARLGGKGEG